MKSFGKNLYLIGNLGCIGGTFWLFVCCILGARNHEGWAYIALWGWLPFGFAMLSLLHGKKSDRLNGCITNLGMVWILWMSLHGMREHEYWALATWYGWLLRWWSLIVMGIGKWMRAED